MNSFQDELAQRLVAIREQGLLRELRRVTSAQGAHITLEGQPLLNFSSNDYLALANEPALKEAAQKATAEFGAGAGASRLLCGSLAPHHELEQTLADFKSTEAALSFSSGYATAIGTIGALAGKDDILVTDELVHASIIDAARLCRATVHVFPHNDLNALEDILQRTQLASVSTAAPPRRARTLIITESVFSMDGDLAPLREIIELKEKYGAWLMLDEAHATGLYGQRRCGLAEAYELADRVEIQMGTLGKALGAAGGYICGPRVLIDLLVNRARSFIFSTAPVPAAAAAATAAIRFVQSGEGEARRVRLWQRVDQVKNTVIGVGWNLPPVRSAILPLWLGEEARAVQAATALRARGIFIPAIRYPTVARGQARLRLTVTAGHTAEDVAQLGAALTSSGLKSEI
jgi:8-amino-7-oxononanoate synthase